MKIFISTSDKYLHLLKPFSFLFNKFWSQDQQVTILGYKSPTFKLPNNFNFISMGMSINDPIEWSGDLRNFFETIKDEWSIYATEDMFLVHPVNFKSLYKLKKFMINNVGRICLTNDTVRKSHIVVEDNVIELTQDADYRISCIYSIWNKEYMLKYLQPKMTPWDFELKGTHRAKNDGYRILGVNSNFPIYLSLAIRRGNFNKLDFRVDNEYHRTLDKNIIDEMKQKEII